MAGGVMNASAGGGEKKEYPGRMTVFGFLACLVASSGGLIFGYDIGISGGVTSMDSFLQKFFPKVYLQQLHDTKTNQYCKFDSQMVTMFTSSLYLAALISSFFASSITRAFGRKWSMFSGGLTFLVGASINGGAQDIWMLIAGRILLGIGVGFTAQSVPLYVAEMAPMKVRGTLNIGFQLMITVGILCANVINYFTVKIKGGWGWRVSLALATVPAVIITVGSLFLPDTPTSLIERGHAEKAKVMLQRIRGTEAIQVEYEDIVAACESSKAIKHPWSNLTKRKYRPQLTMAILIPFFQQITGINVVMFYAPVLFKTIGYGSDASLMSAVVTGGVNMVATFISIATVDRMGRRILFLEGGLQMLISQVAIGVLMQQKFGTSGQALSPLTKSYADILLLFIGVYTAAFAWSWGPLGWLVPSEIFPLQIRSACQAIVVSVNMLFTFVIAQAFLAALCHLKFCLFYAFAGWVVIMTVFVFFFLPETKNRPIEEMGVIWKKHWFWKKFVGDDDADASNMEMGKKSVE